MVARMTWGEFKTAVDEQIAKAGADNTLRLDMIRYRSTAGCGPVEIWIEPHEKSLVVHNA